MRASTARRAAALAGVLALVITLEASAAVEPGAAGAAPATAAGEQAQFDIGEFRVLGASVLERRKVEAAVYPFLGPRKSLQTVEQARAALVAAYRDAGYGTVTIDIPEQSVDDGVVRLQVTEGRIEKVRISGARYYSERRILAELPALKPGTVPQLPQLQSELGRLAGEARDLEVTPILKAGSEPGTVAVDLKAKDHVPLHGSLEVNNRYTADTTPTRLTGSLSYDNMFQRDESLSLQYQTAPAAPSQVKLGVVTYNGRTADPDWAWAAYAIRSDSSVAAIGTLDVIGRGKIFGGRLIDSFETSERRISSLTFGLDYKDFGQDILLPGSLQDSSPIHYLLWSGQYAATRLGKHLDFNTSLAINFGVRGLAGSDPEFEFKRSGATANFAYLRGSSSLTWRTWGGLSVVGRFQYQYAEQPLVSNEQFSLGGVDTVRGYLEAEELVDSGVAGTLELRSPVARLGGSQTVGYLFYDRGIGMMQQPLVSEITSGSVRTDLYSFGAGFHFTGYGVNGSLDWAQPRVSGSRTLHGDSRFDFSLAYGF